MLAYIASPIDQRTYNSWLEAAEAQLATRLNQIGCGAYRPQSGWTLNPGALAWERTGRAVAEVNRCAQSNSAITVSLLPDDLPTLGVPVEIERALGWGQPVVLCAAQKVRSSIQYAEWVARGAIEATPDQLGEAIYLALATEAQDVSLDLQVAEVHEKAKLPSRGYDSDAGFDLAVLEDTLLDGGEYRDLECGFSMAMPEGTWGLLIARSSTARRGLAVNTVVIDPGYTGPMYVGVTNLHQNAGVVVKAGERLAQIVPLPFLARGVGVVEVEQLPVTDRGSNGRGSSGA